MAFVPTIPASIEQMGIGLVTGQDQVTSDSASYSYTRAVVDPANDFQTQNAYSGVIFGAAQEQGEVEPGTQNGLDYTAGVVANAITTASTNPVGITRQYIQQTGKATVTTQPETPFDNENVVDTPVFTASLSKSNLAWISGDLTDFTVTPTSLAAVGGNYLDPVLDGLVTPCGNIWLDENEVAQPIKITTTSGLATGSDGKLGTATQATNLKDAYAGSASTASITAYPAEQGTGSFFDPAYVTMSGYSERFAGFDGADVPNTGKVTTDFGTGATVTDSWNSNAGTPFEVPTNADFPASGATWP
jgi:hypothetical protein